MHAAPVFQAVQVQTQASQKSATVLCTQAETRLQSTIATVLCAQAETRLQSITTAKERSALALE